MKLTKGNWENELVYAYSARFDETPTFEQEADCIKNNANAESTAGYEWISLFAKDKIEGDFSVSTTCSFEECNAPLVVLAHDLYEENGVMRFCDYHEVVIYGGGINVWKLWRENGKMIWHKKLGVDIPFAANEKHKLTVSRSGYYLDIEADGNKMRLRLDDMPKSFYVGITACEGINRFYDFDIELTR